MLLTEKATGHLVEVLKIEDLFNPYHAELKGRYNFGEEAQDPEQFDKAKLKFLSGESLPRCWLDPHYRDSETHKRQPQSSVIYVGAH